MEAQQLGHAMSAALQESSRRAVHNPDWEDVDVDNTTPDPTAAPDTDGTDPFAAVTGAADGAASNSTAGADGDTEGAAAEEHTQPEQTKKGSKLLCVENPRVVMFTPGVGVRPFHFGERV